MIKLLLLLKKIHYVLLFLILECIALYSYTNSSPYGRAFAMQISTQLSGGLNEQLTSVGNYFTLNEQNNRLTLENAELRQQLLRYQAIVDSVAERFDTLDSTLNISAPEKILVANVIRNSYNKQNNFITLDKGTNDGMKRHMALFTNKGIIGYTINCSPNYTIAISALNIADFRTGGRLKGTDFTGSISWDGKNYQRLTIEELPKYANIKIGDTIVTTFSNIFPENLPIGTIESYSLTSGTFYTATLKMFADMSSLGYVYATALQDQQELLTLEAQVGITDQKQ